MSRRDDYRVALNGMTAPEISVYLTAHSGLPGPRGNLELLDAFGDVGDAELIRKLAVDPDEYLRCCGVVGLGRLLVESHGDDADAIVLELHERARDELWRVREAVAIALQRLGDADPARLRAVAADWVQEWSGIQCEALARGEDDLQDEGRGSVRGPLGDQKSVDGHLGDQKSVDGHLGDQKSVDGHLGDQKSVDGHLGDQKSVNGQLGDQKSVDGPLGDRARVGGPLVSRAAIAAICEPRLLKDASTSSAALDACAAATTGLLAVPADDRRRDDVRTLRQALGYCWSVAIAAAPDRGLVELARLQESTDPDIMWIVRENLRKARLQRVLAAAP